MPITLLYFNADIYTPGIRLNWATAQENGNAYFEIQRSGDGSHFAAIGRINSLGDNRSTTYYYFTDSIPGKGANFYRLRQVDKDGKDNYSEVKRVLVEPTASLLLLPNPVLSTLTVTRAGARIDEMQVFALDGRLVLSQTIAGATGTINMGSLPAGVYIVRVLSGGTVYTEKVMKQ